MSDVILAVQTHLVTAADYLLTDIRVTRELRTEKKERCLCLRQIECVEHTEGRILIGSVIEREHRMLSGRDVLDPWMPAPPSGAAGVQPV